jgi:hypothetical protein
METLLIFLLVGIVIGLVGALRVGARKSAARRSKRTKILSPKTVKTWKKFFANLVAVVIFVGIVLIVLAVRFGG